MSSPPAVDLNHDRLAPSEPGLRSIARQLSRRLDACFVGEFVELVAEHRLDEDEALETIRDLVVTNPGKAFEL